MISRRKCELAFCGLAVETHDLLTGGVRESSEDAGLVTWCSSYLEYSADRNAFVAKGAQQQLAGSSSPRTPTARRDSQVGEIVDGVGAAAGTTLRSQCSGSARALRARRGRFLRTRIRRRPGRETVTVSLERTQRSFAGAGGRCLLLCFVIDPVRHVAQPRFSHERSFRFAILPKWRLRRQWIFERELELGDGEWFEVDL